MDETRSNQSPTNHTNSNTLFDHVAVEQSGQVRDTQASATSVSWQTTAIIHTVLIVFTVTVIWATLGRDPHGSAAASAFEHPKPNETASSLTTPSSATLIDRTTAMQDASPQDAASSTRTGSSASAASQATSVMPGFIAAAPMPAMMDQHITTQPLAKPWREPTIHIPGEASVVAARQDRQRKSDAYADHGRLFELPAAHRVVYLIDASGSLIDTLPFVQQELRRSLTTLKPEQHFAVVFFQAGQAIEVPPVGMSRASTPNLDSSIRWLDPLEGHVIAQGSADPAAAIRRALAYDPDAVVLISDGLTGRVNPLADRDRVLTLIETANLHHIPFHTVQLRRPDPMATSSRLGTLDMISAITHGQHRYLSEQDLVSR